MAQPSLLLALMSARVVSAQRLVGPPQAALGRVGLVQAALVQIRNRPKLKVLKSLHKEFA